MVAIPIGPRIGYDPLSFGITVGRGFWPAPARWP